jgi:hypothetical protein
MKRPRPVPGRSVAAAIELAEDPLLLGLRDSDSFVFDAELDAVARAARDDGDGSATGRELDGIVNKSGQDLSQLVAVGVRGERLGGQVEHERCPFWIASSTPSMTSETIGRTSVGCRFTCKSPVSRRATFSSASTIFVSRADSEAM